MQAPIDFIQRGSWGGEEIGLELVDGYQVHQLRLQFLDRNWQLLLN